MKYSKTQYELWEIKEKISKKLLAMTPEQRLAYLAGATARLEAKTGKRLNLRKAKLGPAGSSK